MEWCCLRVTKSVELFIAEGVRALLTLSLAKAHQVLDVDVTPAAVAAIAIMMIIIDSMVDPAADFVVSRKICMKGKPVGVASKTSKGPVE